MTEQQITFYGDLFQRLSLTELKIEEEGCSLYMKKDLVSGTTPCIPNGAKVITSPEPDTKASEAESDSRELVKAPLLGIFHRAPSPDEPPFAEVGDRVQKGDILCVIEAMKMMNEIAATRDGIVTEVCAEENSIVEYGQPIFRIS